MPTDNVAKVLNVSMGIVQVVYLPECLVHIVTSLRIVEVLFKYFMFQ